MCARESLEHSRCVCMFNLLLVKRHNSPCFSLLKSASVTQSACEQISRDYTPSSFYVNDLSPYIEPFKKCDHPETSRWSLVTQHMRTNLQNAYFRRVLEPVWNFRTSPFPVIALGLWGSMVAPPARCLSRYPSKLLSGRSLQLISGLGCWPSPRLLSLFSSVVISSIPRPKKDPKPCASGVLPERLLLGLRTRKPAL